MTARRVSAFLVALVLLVGLVVGTLVLRSGGDDRPRPTAAELAAYEEAILPTVKDWGSVEVLGMKPAVADLASGKGVPARTIVVEAAAWEAALRADGDKLQAVGAPPGLTAAPPLFDESIGLYLEAAALFKRAAQAKAGPTRTELIEAGRAKADEGAHVYNAASAFIQAAHRRLGQPPSPDFPDHP